MGGSQETGSSELSRSQAKGQWKEILMEQGRRTLSAVSQWPGEPWKMYELSNDRSSAF